MEYRLLKINLERSLQKVEQYFIVWLCVGAETKRSVIDPIQRKYNRSIHSITICILLVSFSFDSGKKCCVSISIEQSVGIFYSEL